MCAGLFEQAVALDPRAEEGYFEYARYLDQHMRDARDRQERARAARAEAQARAKDGGVPHAHHDTVNRDDRLGGRSKSALLLLLPALSCVPAPGALFAAWLCILRGSTWTLAAHKVVIHSLQAAGCDVIMAQVQKHMTKC